MYSRNGIIKISVRLMEALKLDLIPTRLKTIDRSRVPELKESDLIEKFIKGEGPGGQNVNKRNTTVYLVHKPTGLSVKMGDLREQYRNREKAREKMVTLLDNLINKENSVENQKLRIFEEKLKKRNQKQKKLNEKKKKWREMLNVSENNE